MSIRLKHFFFVFSLFKMSAVKTFFSSYSELAPIERWKIQVSIFNDPQLDNATKRACQELCRESEYIIQRFGTKLSQCNSEFEKELVFQELQDFYPDFYPFASQTSEQTYENDA